MSTQRAFVIQFGQRPAGSPDWFQGRVEHVGTGEATHFTSPRELLDFLFRLIGHRAAALAAAAGAAPDPAPAPAAPPPVTRRGPRSRPRS